MLLQKYNVFDEEGNLLKNVLNNEKLSEENLMQHKCAIYCLVGRLNESEDLRMQMEEQLEDNK